MNVDEIKKMLKDKQDVEGEAESTHCASSCDSYDCDAISHPAVDQRSAVAGSMKVVLNSEPTWCLFNPKRSGCNDEHVFRSVFFDYEGSTCPMWKAFDKVSQENILWLVLQR